MTRVRLTTEETLALAESVRYSLDAVGDLLQIAHRTSAERHRAARMAVAVAHVIDGIETGELDVAAPHVREWLAGERKLCAEYATEHAQWLRELRDRRPSALEGLSSFDVPRRERELSTTVDDALGQVIAYERLLAEAGTTRGGEGNG